MFFFSVPILDGHSLSHNLVMKHIPGADPELVLLNHYFEELDVSFLCSVFILLYLLFVMQYMKAHMAPIK